MPLKFTYVEYVRLIKYRFGMFFIITAVAKIQYIQLTIHFLKLKKNPCKFIILQKVGSCAQTFLAAEKESKATENLKREFTVCDRQH